jgi:hypothetical protein
MEALGLLERRGSRSVSREKEELDPAVQVTVNPRFGLVAVGTQGCVSISLSYLEETSADDQWKGTPDLSPVIPLQTTSFAYIRPETLGKPSQVHPLPDYKSVLTFR